MRQERPPNPGARRLRGALATAWLWLVCLFASFPIFYMLATSFKTRAMLYEPTTPEDAPPANPPLRNA